MFLWYPQKGAFRAQYTKSTADSGSAELWKETGIGYYSTALGNSNVAKGRASFAAGSHNEALSHSTSILGGQNNIIAMTSTDNKRFRSTIVGGKSNKITGPYNIIGAGKENTITPSGPTYRIPEKCFIGGGYQNKISNSHFFSSQILSTILGGYKATISTSSKAGIGGGYSNTIEGYNNIYSGVLGGNSNRISNGYYSAAAGGHAVYITKPFSVKGGGGRAFIYGHHSIIMGGSLYKPFPGSIYDGSDYTAITNSGGSSSSSNSTQTSGAYTTIAGTHVDGVNGDYNFIGGNDSFEIDGDYSAVLGSTQGVSGHYNFVSQDKDNGSYLGNDTGIYGTSGSYSVNHRGKSTGYYSWTFSTAAIFSTKGALNTASRSFAFTNSVLGNAGSDTFIINNTNPIRVGIGVTYPQKALDVAGTVRATKIKIVNPEHSPSGSAEMYYNSETQEIFRQDIAESFKTSEPVEPGDILVIDPDNPEKLKKSSQTYETTAIGVVSSLPAIVFEYDKILIAPEEPVKQTTTPPVALAGRVKIKISLENGVIEPGDLLTSSSQPGVAMKAEDPAKATHAIIGKSLQAYSGTDETKMGFITAIVTLR